MIGGLGGGGFGAALQGAAGAGLSAAMAKQLDDVYKGVGSATGSAMRERTGCPIRAILRMAMSGI